MTRDIQIYNTLTRKKEKFVPITPGRVGLYVCGPTVYGEPHLGHARPGVTFDVLVRLFKQLGYKVRYVRNITDVGHLEHDSDSGEDKIEKKARLEELEPMEIAQTYTISFHHAMDRLNNFPPSIEPHASGHIIEQIELIKKIIEHGYAYVINGSVYFDVAAYNKKYHYGELSGRNLDDMMTNTRTLDGQDEKRSPADFALWKKAQPEHIMRWPSPWSDGFPGWHLECSAMGEKYLGKEFDIHGGGMDLMFPHHECEIAQNKAERGTGGVHYWMHNNMITINGQKMGKSLGNFITLNELFTGTHKLLTQAYTPMTIRFFILQAQYRGTLDFSNEALQAAEKGYKRMMQAAKDVKSLKVLDVESALKAGNAGKVSASNVAVQENKSEEKKTLMQQLEELYNNMYDALCDDLNTPVALSYLFEAVKIVNQAKDGTITVGNKEKELLERIFSEVAMNVLGLKDEDESAAGNGGTKIVDGLMNLVLAERKEAREKKDWAKSDVIRDTLNKLGVKVKDNKEGGTDWSIE